MDGTEQHDNELGYHDQDSEPPLTAPEEKGPDGITAPKPDDADSDEE